MVIDTKRIEKMKELVESAKKSNAVVQSEKAFKAYPPEGVWEKEENGTVTVATVKEATSV